MLGGMWFELEKHESQAGLCCFILLALRRQARSSGGSRVWQELWEHRVRTKCMALRCCV